MTGESSYIGKQFGSYQIIKELTHGGFGSVCLGKHVILTGRPIVAIKILHAHLSSRQERDRFLREAQILEELKHPNILPLLDVNIQENVPYHVVEYAPG